jgi:hypothetical protein
LSSVSTKIVVRGRKVIGLLDEEEEVGVEDVVDEEVTVVLAEEDVAREKAEEFL